MDRCMTSATVAGTGDGGTDGLCAATLVMICSISGPDVTSADSVRSPSRYVPRREFTSPRSADYQPASNQRVTAIHRCGCVTTRTEHSVISSFKMASLISGEEDGSRQS